MTDETLASELLHQIKMNAKRWFIAFIIMVGIELVTIAGFLWYISLPVEVTETEYEQEMDDVTNSTAIQRIGDIYGQDETDSTQAQNCER